MNIFFDPLRYRCPSRRSLVYGRRGMVCTSQPLAAQAGLDILKKGGNAFDAALATAACLAVVEPMSCNMGGDGFALIWHQGKLYGLNASGPAPALLSVEALKQAGYKEMPKFGWEAVTVPGVTSGWAEINKRFGKLPLTEIFAPAISYAEEGFPVSPTISALWKRDFQVLKDNTDPEFFRLWAADFSLNGRPPMAGEVVRFPGMAKTLQELAATNCESFYRGDLADRIDSYSKESGGYLRKKDLASYRAEWVEPITTNYKGYDVWEIPPNGHGIVVLMALNILETMDVARGREDADVIHRQMEALKLAFSDGKRYVTDPAYMKPTVEQLLSRDYAAKRRELIESEAMDPKPGTPYCGDTIYLNAADGDGNMISYIQSIYCPFGSGITLPGTGILFQNRGHNFTMDETMENCVAPGKKPYHTIIPGFLSKDGQAIGPFGVMGGFMQPQGHVQVLMNMIDFHMNPQEALDAPRWMWTGGKDISIEPGFGADTIYKLTRMGHNMSIPNNNLSFGRGQIIIRNEDGTLCGATEPRTDGTVAVW